ncbi:hypothetical protein [Allomuricauda sp. NBRC 101325]|uniref:hypothetical protein n=1 Tax=Allomuricauda sp. NBRC 101325 TaxID=1113758 RepID=UPI0024A5C00A|nr:hypothetical protein [Muricauda sp. NBRC 101325]GLU44583.1 hypothetical protein Musp01_22070 [Muricauda sp. NBRC 101325]
MKTIATIFVSLVVSITFINCSSDDPDQSLIINEQNSKDNDQPVTGEMPPHSTPEGTVALKGFPKSVQYYYIGILQRWEQYYFRSDGKLLMVHTGYPGSGSEIITDIYQYNENNQLTGLDGYDEYSFQWENNIIVGASTNNVAWHGRIEFKYEYNTDGQIIQQTFDYLDTTPPSSGKITYTYFDDGNLKTMEHYWRDDLSENYSLSNITQFDGYKGDNNLFFELTIIPGQSAQLQFPSTSDYKQLTSSGYDRHETYQYVYDIVGRVVEKLFGDDKVVYQYYE